jgi:hypothetical protein
MIALIKASSGNQSEISWKKNAPECIMRKAADTDSRENCPAIQNAISKADKPESLGSPFNHYLLSIDHQIPNIIDDDSGKENRHSSTF